MLGQSERTLQGERGSPAQAENALFVTSEETRNRRDVTHVTQWRPRCDLRLCTATAAARQAQHDQLENSSVCEINETQLLFKKLILLTSYELHIFLFYLFLIHIQPGHVVCLSRFSLFSKLRPETSSRHRGQAPTGPLKLEEMSTWTLRHDFDKSSLMTGLRWTQMNR